MRHKLLFVICPEYFFGDFFVFIEYYQELSKMASVVLNSQIFDYGEATHFVSETDLFDCYH